MGASLLGPGHLFNRPRARCERPPRSGNLFPQSELSERRLKVGFPRSSPTPGDCGGIGEPASEMSEEPMTPKTIILLAAGAAALVLPAGASAQQYYGQPEYRQPQYEGQRDYDQPHGDYGAHRGRFSGYPQFRGIEAHIRSEIMQAVRDDMIERDDARELMGQLRDIQMREAREFRVHGWNLPGGDQQRIRAQLGELDHQVDQIRNES
jgi:hypothetical protein